MNILTETGHATGGIKDRVDLRDFDLKEIAGATPAFDWNAGFDIETKLPTLIPVKDQGQSFSCGGQAWSYLATVLEALATGSLEERSAKYVYAQTYQQGGGSTGRDNANIFGNQGVARETFTPSYQNSQPPTEAFITRGGDITAEARTNALLDRSFPYAQVTGGINETAKAIRDFYGVILGIDGQDNGTWLSAFPQPPQTTVWRHWVYAGRAKMINGQKYIGILNSWGVSTGDRGWQWLSEDFFTSGHVWSQYTHVTTILVPPVGFHHTFNVDMQYGSQNNEVKALQTALQLEGVFPSSVAPAGYFGLLTKGAVVKYQILKGIEPVGRCGPLTRAALNQTYA